MPKWAGKWKGGRYYLDARGQRVFFIERRGRVLRLQTHDPDLALGELSRFLQDPAAFCRPAPAPENPEAVHITKERIAAFLQSRRKTTIDNRKARRYQLHAWAEYRGRDKQAIDLRSVPRQTLRDALASFDGGHRGRTEALNAFARFLVSERDLDSWAPLTNPYDPSATRAERVAYSLEEVAERYLALKGQPRIRAVLLLRATTGMHHTEIEQVANCAVYKGPLPDRGAGIRILEGRHEIKGVIQFRQKTKPRHRVSVGAEGLAAALFLRAGVPRRSSMHKFLDPLVPSNLRHTYITWAGEVGELVAYKAAGVPLDQIQSAVGHRIGSKITQSSYDKLQVPPMIRLPLEWDVRDLKSGR